MRFQDAARDGRAVVYAGIQADPLVARIADMLVEATLPELVMARAVMNGARTDPAVWRAMFPALFDAGRLVAAGADRRDVTARADAILEASLEVAQRGEQTRSQFRGAIVEELTARLLAHRVPAANVKRERRVLFDGVAAEIHPYDVTVELGARAEIYDCKWGARGINADVLHQLDDARRHAVEEEQKVLVALVIFDSRRSTDVRLARMTAPRSDTRFFTLESIGRLAGTRK